MSNADELIKFKKLLDDGIITQEEFEKKKQELLNKQETKTANVNTNTKNNATTVVVDNASISKSKKSHKKGIIIGIVILFIVIIAIGASSMTTLTLETQVQTETGLEEQNLKKVMDILNDCGITYGVVKHNSKYDSKGKKAYDIAMNSNKDIVLMIIEKNKLISLRMLKVKEKEVKDKYLYKDNKKVATLSDYIMTQSNTTNTTTTERFTLVSDKGSYDSFGYATITGTIKNNTNRTYSYVQVTFTLYDKSGAQVGTAMDNINNLEANGTWKFKAIGFGSTEGTSYKLTGIDGW